jgi:hypothetical protein
VNRTEKSAEVVVAELKPARVTNLKRPEVFDEAKDRTTGRATRP